MPFSTQDQENDLSKRDISLKKFTPKKGLNVNSTQ